MILIAVDPHKSSHTALAVDPEESETSATRTRPMASVDELQRRASEHGVGAQFKRFIDAFVGAGLYLRPYVHSVMVTPPGDRNRFLMLATPVAGSLELLVGNEAFAEFWPQRSEAEITEVLGEY